MQLDRGYRDAALAEARRQAAAEEAIAAAAAAEAEAARIKADAITAAALALVASEVVDPVRAAFETARTAVPVHARGRFEHERGLPQLVAADTLGRGEPDQRKPSAVDLSLCIPSYTAADHTDHIDHTVPPAAEPPVEGRVESGPDTARQQTPPGPGEAVLARIRAHYRDAVMPPGPVMTPLREHSAALAGRVAAWCADHPQLPVSPDVIAQKFAAAWVKHAAITPGGGDRLLGDDALITDAIAAYAAAVQHAAAKGLPAPESVALYNSAAEIDAAFAAAEGYAYMGPAQVRSAIDANRLNAVGGVQEAIGKVERIITHYPDRRDIDIGTVTYFATRKMRPDALQARVDTYVTDLARLRAYSGGEVEMSYLKRMARVYADPYAMLIKELRGAEAAAAGDALPTGDKAEQWLSTRAASRVLHHMRHQRQPRVRILLPPASPRLPPHLRYAQTVPALPPVAEGIMDDTTLVAAATCFGRLWQRAANTFPEQCAVLPIAHAAWEQYLDDVLTMQRAGLEQAVVLAALADAGTVLPVARELAATVPPEKFNKELIRQLRRITRL